METFWLQKFVCSFSYLKSLQMGHPIKLDFKRESVVFHFVMWHYFHLNDEKSLVVVIQLKLNSPYTQNGKGSPHSGLVWKLALKIKSWELAVLQRFRSPQTGRTHPQSTKRGDSIFSERKSVAWNPDRQRQIAPLASQSFPSFLAQHSCFFDVEILDRDALLAVYRLIFSSVVISTSDVRECFLLSPWQHLHFRVFRNVVPASFDILGPG